MDHKAQSEKFEKAARELECDDDPEHLRERLGKLIKHEPAERSDGQPRARRPLRSQAPRSCGMGWKMATYHTQGGG